MAQRAAALSSDGGGEIAERRVQSLRRMAGSSLTDLLCRSHRTLSTRIATLQVDPRARRERVVTLAEELVAHATAEQVVLYPFAEQLLGLHDLSFELERSLDALLGVVGGIGDDLEFRGAMARLSSSFDRHVDGDEVGLLPMVEALGAPEHLSRMGLAIAEFERSLAMARANGAVSLLKETQAETWASGGRSN